MEKKKKKHIRNNTLHVDLNKMKSTIPSVGSSIQLHLILIIAKGTVDIYFFHLTSVILFLVFHLHRDTTPAHGKTCDIIREAIVLTRNDRINLESLKSLRQVCRHFICKVQHCKVLHARLYITLYDVHSRNYCAQHCLQYFESKIMKWYLWWTHTTTQLHPTLLSMLHEL